MIVVKTRWAIFTWSQQWNSNRSRQKTTESSRKTTPVGFSDPQCGLISSWVAVVCSLTTHWSHGCCVVITNNWWVPLSAEADPRSHYDSVRPGARFTKYRQDGMGSVVSFPSGVRGGAPAEIKFGKLWMPKKPSGGTYFTECCFHSSIVVLQLYGRFEWKEDKWRTHDMHGFPVKRAMHLAVN